jgi:hypothetical protein
VAHDVGGDAFWALSILKQVRDCLSDRVEDKPLVKPEVSLQPPEPLAEWLRPLAVLILGR